MYNLWRATVFWWWIGAKEERGVDTQVRNGADGWLGRRVAWSRVAPSRDRAEGLEHGNHNHFIRNLDQILRTSQAIRATKIRYHRSI
jgi:hypothetical protein